MLCFFFISPAPFLEDFEWSGKLIKVNSNTMQCRRNSLWTRVQKHCVNCRKKKTKLLCVVVLSFLLFSKCWNSRFTCKSRRFLKHEEKLKNFKLSRQIIGVEYSLIENVYLGMCFLHQKPINNQCPILSFFGKRGTEKQVNRLI